jgi:DNA modification methylase
MGDRWMTDNRALLPMVSNSPRLQIEWVPITSLKLNTTNPRRHSQKQITKIAKSINQVGFVAPCLVEDENRVLAGNARIEAAAQLGMTEVPVVRLRHLSEPDKRALIIADNKLAELASWDETLLRQELAFLNDLDIDFDFSAIGFDTAEVDFILGGGTEADDRADALPAIVDVDAVSQPGDLWLLGDHRLYCGSALERSSYDAVLAGNRAAMVFMDPPYNVPIDGHVGGKGPIKHREFAMASDEMPLEAFEAFLSASLGHITNFAKDGAICFVCMDWRHVGELLAAAKAFTLKNICVWVKNNGGMGSLYRSQHEFVFVLKCGNANHISNIELGKHGRNRTNVWEYRVLNSFGSGRDELLKSHPTVKPVAMVADAIKDCSHRGELILDPFAGSGTTLIAAEKTKRRSALIELDPLYVDAIVRRWETYTGKQAVCAASGMTFAERQAQVERNPFPEGSPT